MKYKNYSSVGESNKYKNTTIAYVAGKSGGHIVPALTMAEQKLKKAPKTTILFFSTAHTLDKNIISTSGLSINHVPLPIKNINYKNPFKFLFFVFSFFYAFFKSLYYLKKTHVQRVISMGGLVSVPVCYAAKLLRIPFDVYELNAVPGKAVALLAKSATQVHICFKNAQQFFPQKKCVFFPYPIRYSVNVLKTNKEVARAKIGFLTDKKTILILGGSQGSVFINTLIKKWVITFPQKAKNTQIIHQTGSYDSTNWGQFYTKNKVNALFFDYKNDLSIYYQAADVVICRSGAGSLFESIFFKKPIITIPLQTTTTAHQIDNAQALKKENSDLSILNQETLKSAPDGFFDSLKAILGD